MKNQEWFEMKDILRKSYNKSVWIPLRAIEYKIEDGKYGHSGYLKELFGSGSIAIPSEQVDNAKKLGWMDIGIGHQHLGWVDDGQYIPAEEYRSNDGKVNGINLVLDQYSNDGSPNIWHLNQDIVLTLGLLREDNSWFNPEDGYIEVARLRKDKSLKPIALEIKAQYLKDYLCARDMALYMTHYFERSAICDDISHINWSNNFHSIETEQDKWEGRVTEIHEGGESFGSKFAVMHVERTDVYDTDDVPDISGVPTNQNTQAESWEGEFEGRKLYFISGELWRNEIILPGKFSHKIRGDMIEKTTSFIIDENGEKIFGDDLVNSGKWLWFKPDVIIDLCQKRGGGLSFYTAHTGSVSCSYSSDIHFGVNELSLINVFAKDIGLLPEWQQKIWAANNVSPEGGVSAELLASQVRATPAETLAPETFLAQGINKINQIAQKKLKIKIFRDHESIPDLIKRTHRFRALDEPSFYTLAKDLARLIVDSLDASSMQTIVSPPKKEKWGSLKSLENLLASKHDRDLIRTDIAPLVGVYELRHLDAHLPTNKIEDAFKLIDIDRGQQYVNQGFQLLHNVVSSLYKVAEHLDNF